MFAPYYCGGVVHRWKWRNFHHSGRSNKNWMSLFHWLHPGLPSWEIQRGGFHLAIGFDISSRSLHVPSYTFSNPSFTVCPFLVHQSFWKASLSFVSLKRIHLQWMCSSLRPQQTQEEIQELSWALAFPKILPQISFRLLLLQCTTATRIQRFCLSFHWIEFLFSSHGGSSGRSVSVYKGKTEHSFTIKIYLLKTELQQSLAQLSK